MTRFTEYVNATDIWATAKSYEDKGERDGFVRGYNVEVVTPDGRTDWLSCSWIYGDPNDHFNDDFHTWCRAEDGLEYTGRICFRGYGIEMWDFEERDYYIIMEDSEEGQALLKKREEARASYEEDDEEWDEDESDDEYEELDDIDSDMGFDPYAGCYTYDC